MLIFTQYKKYKKFLVIIFLIINIFLITSCTLKDFKKNNDILFNERKQLLKMLIVPKGTFFPKKNNTYNIPYTNQELQKENYNIFPPV